MTGPSISGRRMMARNSSGEAAAKNFFNTGCRSAKTVAKGDTSNSDSEDFRGGGGGAGV